MFAIRSTASTRCLQPLLRRANATLQSTTASSSSTPPPPPINSTKSTVTNGDTNVSDASMASTKPVPTRRRRRPSISLTNPRTWCRPVPERLIPAYDEALKVIEKDSAELKAELKELSTRIERLKSDPNCDKEELIALEKKAGIVEIQSEINLPSVRWYFANGMGDMNKLVYRHLAEQKWRNKGALDLLMERIHQMHVIPDLLPDFHPSFDLRLTFPEAPPKSAYLRSRVKRKHAQVEPGVFLLPVQTYKPPKLYTTVFHPETRYYTLVLVDADVPDPENKSFTTYLHWMQTNIQLSATTPSPVSAVTHTEYIPPHPQRGSPYHRYCLFLLPNPNPNEKVSIPHMSNSERRGFNLREFCKTYGFDPANGGGAHMWREVWDETVSKIYKETLKLPEPHYALPPRLDPYDYL